MDLSKLKSAYYSHLSIVKDVDITQFNTLLKQLDLEASKIELDERYDEFNRALDLIGVAVQHRDIGNLDGALSLIKKAEDNAEYARYSAPSIWCELAKFYVSIPLPEESLRCINKAQDSMNFVAGPNELVLPGNDSGRWYPEFKLEDYKEEIDKTKELVDRANMDPIFPVYENTLISSEPSSIKKILTVSNERWDEIINYFARHPEKLYNYDPHKFEELVAELLTREGMRVQLTPRAKDSGRDILAFLDTTLGTHLHLVECKRYSTKRPIRVDLVRNLYGVVEAERATAGLLVTTSYFTDEAISFRNQVKHRLALKDYKNLVKWLRL